MLVHLPAHCATNVFRYTSSAKLLYAQKGLNEPQRKRFFDFNFSRLILGESPEILSFFQQMYETRMKQQEQGQQRSKNSFEF